MRYFQTYDADGFVMGNYNDDVHKENIPVDAVEITEAEFQQWEADPENRIIDTVTKLPKMKPAPAMTEVKAKAVERVNNRIEQKNKLQAILARNYTQDITDINNAVDAAAVQTILDSLP